MQMTAIFATNREKEDYLAWGMASWW